MATVMAMAIFAKRVAVLYIDVSRSSKEGGRGGGRARRGTVNETWGSAKTHVLRVLREGGGGEQGAQQGQSGDGS